MVLRRDILLFLLFISSILIQAQITGTPNSYSEVSSVDQANGSVQVANPSLFSSGDRVVLMQMKGAVVQSANTASFGSISSQNGAGLYELNSICEVNGSEIVFENLLQHTYNPASVAEARIQLIKVPQYSDVTIGSLTVPAWDGNKGGVLVLEASGTITLAADINLDGKGFRGGTFENLSPSFGCSFLDIYPDQFYQQSDSVSGLKGEGISEYILNREYGKGPMANGGGGANDHNAGGAGGGNYGAGGIGGERHNVNWWLCQGQHPGRAAKSLSSVGYSSSNSAVYMGGGGGAGHGNNNEGVDAGNGGGIIILIANELEGAGHKISVSGETPSNAGSDGGSGGGAGGSILLNVGSYGVGSLTLEADGGNGGGAGYIGNDCHGPGGGGGGGVIWVSNSLTGNVSTSSNGGAKGIVDPTIGCGTSGGGVGAGANGIVIQSPTLSIPQNISTNPQCALPVSFVYATIEEQNGLAMLSWGIDLQSSAAILEVERSVDGIEFISLNHQSHSSGHSELLEQSWIDPGSYLSDFNLSYSSD